MEGMGVGVLVFLFVTIQNSSDNQLTKSVEASAVITSEKAPNDSVDLLDSSNLSSSKFTGRYARTWNEYVQSRNGR